MKRVHRQRLIGFQNIILLCIYVRLKNTIILLLFYHTCVSGARSLNISILTLHASMVDYTPINEYSHTFITYFGNRIETF